MKRAWILGSVALFLVLLGWSASAALSRAAMITQISGSSTFAKKPVRTLQVFSEGSEVSVSSGAKLRLVYLQSGQKESVSGPCQVRIGSTGSELVGPSTGKVVKEPSSGSQTKLRRSENIRRMGGSLQAYAEHGPGEMIAMIEGPPADSDSAEARSVIIDDSEIRMIGTPAVSVSADAYKELRWRGGTAPYQVTLSRNGEEEASAQTDEPFFAVPKPRVVPGQVYEVKIASRDSKAQLVYHFQVLLPSEKAQLETNIVEFGEMLGGTARDRYIAEIALYEEWGLGKEALTAAQAAVQQFPDDLGFQTALGRAFYNLGELEKALPALEQAKKLENG